jgi:hypothetical protein
MSKGFELAVVIILCLILGIMFYWASRLDDHVDKAKSDIRNLRALLSSVPKPAACPPPGEHTNKVCGYHLQIKKPLNNHKGWYLASIPDEVIKQAKTDCEEAKKRNPEMGDHTCVNPDFYPHTDYAIQVDGTVSDNQVYDFVNDPVTDHLMVYTAEK